MDGKEKVDEANKSGKEDGKEKRVTEEKVEWMSRREGEEVQYIAPTDPGGGVRSLARPSGS
jgi:hypothetical protein